MTSSVASELFEMFTEYGYSMDYADFSVPPGKKEEDKEKAVETEEG